MEILNSNIIGDGEQHLLILHGFLGMGDNWKNHAKNLAKKGFVVHLVDQRNHGRSFWSDDFNYHLLAEDLLNYLNDKGLKEVTLLGHSMGGKTAMEFALSYPQHVKQLIVADIAPKYYAPQHQQILAGLSTLNFKQIKSRKAASDHLENYVTDMGTRQFLLKNLYWMDDGQLGLRSNIAILKNVAEVIGAPIEFQNPFLKPSLFLHGDQSSYINPETDKDMILHSFPKAEIFEIKGAGHWLHAEQPQQFFEKLMQSLY